MVIKSSATVRPHKNISRISFMGNTAGELVQFLYADASVYLERKMQRAVKIMEHIRPECIIARRANSGWVPTGVNPMKGRRTGRMVPCSGCGVERYLQPSISRAYCTRACYMQHHNWFDDRKKRDEIAEKKQISA